MFSWIPIHRETIHRILQSTERQNELLAILREMEQQGLKVISLQDEGADGQTIPLAEMMLLYPTVDSPLSADYTHKGHKIRIRTINLNQPWQSIHQDLLALVA